MKQIVFLLLAMVSLGAVQAQTTPVKDDHAGHDHGPVATAAKPGIEALELKQAEYDFGTIPQGKPVYHYFEILNKSAAPLKLDNVLTTCGCTTPEWTKDPIASGASSKVKVGYNAASEGYFEKFITLQYNGGASKQIKIKGTVWKAPVGSAPANAAVQFLKTQFQ